MVLHLRAPKGKVSVEVMLNRAKYFDRTGKVNDHTIYLSGNLGKNALEFAMCLSAKAMGGRVYTMGHTLVIEEADEAVCWMRYCSCLNHKHEDRKCRAEKNLSGVFSICKDYKAMEEKEASSASSR